MRLHEILFSPTGGTEKAADYLADAVSIRHDKIDLTRREDFSSYHYGEEDLCLFAVPSYSGRVPPKALERISLIKGNNTPAILLTVYGNRAYEDTFAELSDTLTKNGFIPAAGVAAVAEHSIVRTIASGRPDEEDKKEIESFGKIILQRLEKKPLLPVSLPGNRPYRTVTKGTMFPAANDQCTFCSACARSCPVRAIPLASPNTTDTEKCISCMRCIQVCPVHARSLPQPILENITKKLSAVCSDRKKNELF